MAMQGSLRDMSVADIIQMNCQDKKAAMATIISKDKEARLYFKDGNVVHATLDNTSGEEVIYQILAWDDGSFNVDIGAPVETQTIKRNWSGLLLEGAKRLDEVANKAEKIAPVVEQTQGQKDVAIKTLLQEYMTKHPDMDAMAIVGIDGYMRIAELKSAVDPEVLGAIAAAILNLGRRSLGLLKLDQFMHSIIQGESTIVTVSAVNKYTMLVSIKNGARLDSIQSLIEQDKLIKQIIPLV
jgi:predicted regulator of Ras-like GTPase activity (Roadblock/LC7/MglB family)